MRTRYYDISTKGLPMATSTGAELNRYKYSGKEFETRRGFNLYDFHARQYDPALCQFTLIDPKAGDYTNLTPYLYCAANPIMNTDPTGCNPIYNPNGDFLGCTEEGFTGEVYIYSAPDNVDFSKMSMV